MDEIFILFTGGHRGLLQPIKHRHILWHLFLKAYQTWACLYDPRQSFKIRECFKAKCKVSSLEEPRQGASNSLLWEYDSHRQVLSKFPTQQTTGKCIFLSSIAQKWQNIAKKVLNDQKGKILRDYLPMYWLSQRESGRCSAYWAIRHPGHSDIFWLNQRSMLNSLPICKLQSTLILMFLKGSVCTNSIGSHVRNDKIWGLSCYYAPFIPSRTWCKVRKRGVGGGGGSM